MEPEFLFVYGTLRREVPSIMADIMKKRCEFHSNGYIYGKLYDVDNYPAFIKSENSGEKVYGEVFRITEETLIELDKYEECSPDFPLPHEYIRSRELIYATKGDLKAWIYIYNRDISCLKRIESGDYLEYLDKR